MVAETFRRDLRIGLRVLVKERAFCALAVVVLALGICGVTTMFSVVNGVMLRGFGFPNADRLASANFIDPSSANFFGVNGQISSMDFQELLPEQRSFEMLAAYLNGSTVNVTVNGKPQRYTGAYTTESFLRILGVSPKGFAFPTNEELWIPLYSEFPPLPRNDPRANNPAVLGLLRPSVTFDEANAEFTALARRFAAAYPA